MTKDGHQTARARLESDVRVELASYRGRIEGRREMTLLDPAELDAALRSGKVLSGGQTAPPPSSATVESFAIRAAVEAFRDGLVLMFADGVQVTDLETELLLSEDSEIRYVRLTSLRGC